MSFKDWISYVIKRIILHLETPKEERRERRVARREKWSYRWFGMIPFSMKMYVRRQRDRFSRFKRS